MKTKDLTPAFLAALSAPTTWNPTTVGKLLAELGPRLGLRFHWDSGAGIEWMELQGDNPASCVAVWVNAPLAFVTLDVDTELVQTLEHQGVAVVKVPSWRDTAYSIDPQAIRDAGMTPQIKHFWHASEDAVSPEAFCIGNLIWATE